ncbi:MAG: cytochrome C [Actinomyces sp.]|nr:MAG: cytochrome C [Actinomyces sp.]
MIWTDRRRGTRTPVTPGRAVRHLGLALVVVAVLIQAVPYGRAHSNPPVTGEPDWATPRTRELMVRACYGCHSNEVDWPWYADVAPFSWITTRHVDEGREAVNYSEFATRGGSDDTIEVILEGSMPPAYYTRFGLHSSAKLTDAEIAELVEGLRATPGIGEEHEGGEHEGGEHEGGEHDDD